MRRAITQARRFVTRRLRHSTLGTILVYVVDNQLAKLRLVRGNIGTDSGAAHAGWGVEASLAYIDRVHADYLTATGERGFHGRVAEVGPGDNCGVGLMALADGATHVDLVDRFYSARDPEKHAAIYAALIDRTPRLARFRGVTREEGFEGIARRYGEGAAAERFFLDNKGYDFIISRAVMEHVTDPVLSLQRMRDALNPGGVLSHFVDLSDHGMFTAYGFPALHFMTVPAWIYGEMTKATGQPNRVPLSAYRNALPAAEILVTELVGGVAIDPPTPWNGIPSPQRERALALVRSEKAGLQNPYRDERDEDLAVSGFVLTYRRG